MQGLGSAMTQFETPNSLTSQLSQQQTSFHLLQGLQNNQISQNISQEYKKQIEASTAAVVTQSVLWFLHSAIKPDN